MADFTKCSNQTCPLRHTCWRFLAPTGAAQSFAEFRPQFEDCDAYPSGGFHWCEMHYPIPISDDEKAALNGVKIGELYRLSDHKPIENRDTQ